MIVLGFDTATPATAVGLRMADGVTLRARDDPGQGEHPGHTTRLLAMSAELLRQAALDWSDLDRVAVGVGPGRFTGLRVGIATARGLAQSLSVEAVGVSSLRALAEGGAPSAMEAEGVLAVIDARRGEAFAAAYTLEHGSSADGEPLVGRELTSARATAPAGLGASLGTTLEGAGSDVTRWLAVGDGAVLYRAELEALGARVPPDDSPSHRIDGETICRIAASGASAQTIDAIVPDYLRRPDAEVALEGRAPTGEGART